MRVDVNMTTTEDKFSVSSWWASEPDFVIDALRRQIEAASAIWPELKEFRIVGPGVSRAARGAAGGHARAASMSADERSETARKSSKRPMG